MNRQVTSVPIFVKLTLTANASSSKLDANVNSSFPLVIATGNYVHVLARKGLNQKGA